MVGTTLMRVRSGNYRAARYLNSFAIVPVALEGAVARCCSIGEFINSCEPGFSAVLVFCCCLLLDCAVIVRYFE